MQKSIANLCAKVELHEISWCRDVKMSLLLSTPHMRCYGNLHEKIRMLRIHLLISNSFKVSELVIRLGHQSFLHKMSVIGAINHQMCAEE